MMCGVPPEDTFWVTLSHPHLVPSGHPEKVRLGKNKTNKKTESQSLGFKIYSDERERGGMNMNLSPFSVPAHIFESILALDMM